MTPKYPEQNLRIALFAGSFDPFTIGHASIVERGLQLFDRIVVAIGVNASKKQGSDLEERIEAIRRVFPGDEVEVIAFSDRLTVDVARSVGARWLLRGVRSVKDFEYERDMADINRRLTGIETVLLYSLPEHAAVSSSVVKELKSYGHDVNGFLP